MNLQQKQLIASLLIGCLIGAAAGSHFQKMAMHRFWEHGPNTQRLFTRFNNELNLDSQQQETTKKIIQRHHDEMLALQKETLAKFQAIRMAMRADMAKILNPDQQEKFHQMAARWDARHPFPGSQPETAH